MYHFVPWRVAKIKTVLGPNCAGVIRSVTDGIRKAEGMQTMISIEQVAKQDGRHFSSALDSKTMKIYSEKVSSGRHVVAFDIYSEGRTLSSARTMYVCALLMFLDAAKNGMRLALHPFWKKLLQFLEAKWLLSDLYYFRDFVLCL